MKKKLLIIIPAVVILLILCFPVRSIYGDGGTVAYNAVLYNVTHRHSLWTNTKESQRYNPEVEEGALGYITGVEISICGMMIYDNTKSLSSITL